MKDKIKKAIIKNKKYYLIFFILWLILVIVFVAPMACSILEAQIEVVGETGNIKTAFSIGEFFVSIGRNIRSPLESIGKCFKTTYIDTFGKGLLYFSGIYLLAVIIGILKSAPKTEYTDIEHGSSDWSENGEQYKVLDRKEGIILAENNYLPLNKMGNINVLIVGRIRCW